MKNRTPEQMRSEIEEFSRLEAAGLEPHSIDYARDAPTTRRLHIAYILGGNAKLWADEWSRTGEPYPRLSLQDETYDGDTMQTNVLMFYAPGQLSKDSELGAMCFLYGNGQRLGTWARYFFEVQRAQQMIRDLGWTLTDEEQALMATLEKHSQQAPARYVMAA